MGNGVDVKKSTIPEAGNGLFASKIFKAGEWITNYSGPRINRPEAEKLKALNQHSHLRSIQFGFQIIDGIKNSGLALEQHKGGGSFANDSRDGLQNAIFVTVYDETKEKYKILLQALRDIAPEEEIFASYGESWWSWSKQSRISRTS